MIIDLILDRKDGESYSPRAFYNDVVCYGDVGEDIARALDSGAENDVKRELCAYIDHEHYAPDIKDYINSQTWL